MIKYIIRNYTELAHSSSDKMNCHDESNCLTKYNIEQEEHKVLLVAHAYAVADPSTLQR